MVTYSLMLTGRPIAPGAASVEGLLVARARQGDHRAFEALVRKHKDSALSLARRIVSDRDVAEDVTQEAFVKAYLQLERFRGASSFGTWLYRIVVNEARTYLRAARRRQTRWEHQAQSAASRSQEPQLGEQADAVVDLLQAIPEKQRVALALFYLQELSLAEIAAAVGVREGTVKSWLSRGREQLRHLAEERGLL